MVSLKLVPSSTLHLKQFIKKFKVACMSQTELSSDLLKVTLPVQQ